MRVLLMIVSASMLFSGCAFIFGLEGALKNGVGGTYYPAYGYGKTSGEAAAAAEGTAGMTEYGLGVQALVGRPVGSGRTSVYGLASYHRYGFEGGHDHLVRVGAQARQRLGEGAGPWWVGGEVAWLRDTSVYDGGLYADDPAANGFSLGALAGYRLPVEGLDLSLFTGLGLLHFGDFESNGAVVQPGGNSVGLRVGLEMGLPLRRR